MNAVLKGVQNAMSGPPETSLRLRRLDTVEARPVRWLWPGRIPAKFGVLAGMGGLGKSQITLGVAATVTTGGRWPSGEACKPGRVILVTSEDDAADTIVPRLEAAGAALERVEVLEGDTDKDGKPIAFNLDRVERLAAYVAGYAASDAPVRLIVLDPITAFLGRHDGHNNAEVRGLLSPLIELADAHGVAVIAITHLNKAEGTSAANRITGSGAYVQAARVAWLVAEHPEEDGACCMATLKANLSPDKSAIGFRVVPVTTAGGIGTSRVEWGTVLDVDADELLAPIRRADVDLDVESAKGDAARFLIDTLGGGPIASTEIRRMADAAGIANRTLDRAKSDLRVRSARIEGLRGWYWQLPATRAEREAERATDATASEDRQPPGHLALGDVGVLGDLDGEERQGRQERQAPRGPDGGDLDDEPSARVAPDDADAEEF